MPPDMVAKGAPFIDAEVVVGSGATKQQCIAPRYESNVEGLEASKVINDQVIT